MIVGFFVHSAIKTIECLLFGEFYCMIFVAIISNRNIVKKQQNQPDYSKK